MSLVTQVVRLLLTMIPQQRGYVVEEDGVAYETAASEFAETTSELDGVDLEALLRTVPLPE